MIIIENMVYYSWDVGNTKEDIMEEIGKVSGKMGLRDLVLSGLCIMSPLAPFTAYYWIADASWGMVALVYLVSLIAMLFIGYSFLQLSREFPVSGSAYSYVQRSVNPHLGFITGWANLCIYLFIPGFIYVVAGVWLEDIIPSVPMELWVFVFAIINVFVNIKGVSVTTKINNVMFWMQIALIGVFVVLASKAVFIDGLGVGGFSLAPIFQAEHFSIGLLMSAITLAIFGYVGFDTIGALADEAKNPKRDIGRAAIIAILISGSLFIVQTYIAGLAAPDYTQLSQDTALFDVAQQVGGSWLFYALIILNIAAYGITIPINIQSAVARIMHKMSKDDLLPFSSVLAKDSERFGTPVNAIILVNVITLVSALTFNFDLLMTAVNFCAIVMFTIMNYAVIYHFNFTKKERGLVASIKYIVIPAVGILLSLYLLTSFTKDTVILAIIMLLIGVVIGAVKSKGYKKEISIQDI